MEIVIVTYNGMNWLPKCLESCREYSVIIVDNGSTDGTLEYIESNHPNITLLEQKENLGFGQGNNLGISYALEQGADYVFLLNQDAYLHEGCIEKLISTHKQNLDYGILSPIHVNGVGDRLDQRFSNYVSYKRSADFYSDFVLKKSKKEVYEVPFINAAGWLLSRDILEKVGGFDPIFFHYGEDANYCQRACYHNFKIGVVPHAFMNHDREDRIEGTYHIDPLLRLERRVKAIYANVNVENFTGLQNLLTNKKRILLKLSLIMKFAKRTEVRKEIQIIKKAMREIEASKKINMVAGSHYLTDAL